MERTAYLVLENGKTFKGKSFGVAGKVTAEVVFFTGMVGYSAVLTDKSYRGKMVVQTFPMLGNYGVISSDFEGGIIAPAAYIVKSWCQLPSNFRSEGDLDTFFKEKGVIGLCDIDTRSLTEILRENGTMNAVITDDPDSVDLEALKSFKADCSLKDASVSEPTVYPAEQKKLRVVIPDYGCKKSIIGKLNARGCEVVLVSSECSAECIMSHNPDGILLPGGPGDPRDCNAQVDTIKELINNNIPIFAIGLGHQLLALANGMTIEKHKHGHHGSNQPVKNTSDNTIAITYQSHCYIVSKDSIDQAVAKESFINVNDGTCEGLNYKNIPAVSVQFYPDAGGGNNNTEWLYDNFITMMEEEK